MRKNYTFFVVVLLLMGIGVNAQNTWYTLTSGDWDNPDIWTLDPAGGIAVGSRVPSDGDHVVILTGKTVTVPDGKAPYHAPTVRQLSLNCGKVTIVGQLDLRQSTGHTFAELKGNGRLLMAADNYPNVADDSKFVQAGGDEGMCVYYGQSFRVNTPHVFYNLEVDMNSGQALQLSANLTLNGHLLIKNNKLQVGTNATKINLRVNGGMRVEATGEIIVGNGSSGYSATDFHNIQCSGDIVNNGRIRLTNQGSPVYNAYPRTGAAILTLNGATNTTFTCNGITDLNRLVIDKDNPVFSVALSASSESHFRLFGRNNVGSNSKALYIKQGTLQLSGAVFIPTLTEGQDFVIGSNAILWINGGGVRVHTTARRNVDTNVGGIQGSGVAGTSVPQSLSVYGKFKITDGLLHTQSHGFVVWNSGNAIVQVEGGQVYTPGLRSAGSSTGKCTYIQSGGKVTMYGDINSDGLEAASATFSIKGTNNVFMMSGGELDIQDPNYVSSVRRYRAFEVESGEGNYSVSGGTVRLKRINGADYNFYINSTAPVYNLELSTGANALNTVLERQLTVLNDLSISSNTILDTKNFTLEVGRHLSNSGTFKTGFNHITRFIGGLPSQVKGGTVKFNHLELAKADKAIQVELGTGNISIGGNLSIAKGMLNVGVADRNLSGNIDIQYGDISGSSALVLMGSAQQTLNNKAGQNSSFGRLKLNNTASTSQIKLLSDVDAESVLFLRNQIFDLGVYNLDINSADYTSGSWGSRRMFKTAGSGSDKGLTLPIVLNGNFSDQLVQRYPVGTSSGYTSAEIRAKGNGLSDHGKLTVIPVDDYHPTAIDVLGLTSLSYYWKVSYTGLSRITSNNLRYCFTYYDRFPLGSGFWRGWVMNNNIWTDYNGVRNGSVLDFDYGTHLTNDYTLGAELAFDYAMIFYSRAAAQSSGQAQFDSRGAWTLDPDHDGSRAPRTPRSYDVCVIGGANGKNHTIVIDGNDKVSQINILGKSETRISVGHPPTLKMTRVGTGTEIPIVKGNGRVLSTDGKVPASDFSEFCNSSEAIFEYSGGSYPVPTITEGYRWWTPYKISDLNDYPNLHITGTGVKTAGNANLQVKGNLLVDAGAFEMSNRTRGDISVLGHLQMNTGTFTLPNSRARTLNVKGDIKFTGSGQLVVASGGSPEQHQVNLYGNVLQGAGEIDLNKRAKAILHFTGNETATFSKTSGATNFYRLEINKPIGKKVVFNSGFSLPVNAGGALKNLVLTSGECHLNNTAININLTTGGNNFKIPTGTTLRLSNGATVNASGNSGVWLDHALIIDGGKANFDGTKNGGTGSGNSYIEFTASGNSTIDVRSGGVLNVGSQIRRSLNTDEGILKFIQNAGIVNLGTRAGGYHNTRGVFEVLGAGSSFTQAAGDQVTIVRGLGLNNYALYFKPELVDVGAGAGFTIGDDTTPLGQTMAIYAANELGGLTVTGTNAPTAILKVLPATLNGNLTIQKGIFNANGLDLNLKGNLTKSTGASFVANNNTVYFVGINDQIISGNFSFDNVVKETGSASLILDASSPVEVKGNLTLCSGTLNTGTNDLTVQGNLVNNITTLGSGGQGIVMAGTDVQRLGGSGEFYRLTINNPNGVVLPTQSGSVTFSNWLKLQSGVFDIGRNLLVVEEGASIEGNGTATPFSETNMIQTNLSFVDNGIKKYFPEVLSGTHNFIYPIGSLGKYTPVVMAITRKSASRGAIRVKAANEPHITVPRADRNKVLQYNWTMDAEGISDFTADTYMHFYDVDAVGDTASYETGRILLSDNTWRKFGPDYFHGGGSTRNYCHFKFSSTTDSGIDGDYTAGSALPNVVQAYITNGSGGGAWHLGTTWNLYDPRSGRRVPGTVNNGDVSGGIVYIDNGDIVTMPQNFMSAYRTHINQSGVIDVGNSFGHRLGDVAGTGTLKLSSGDFPAGAYAEFFSERGGTIEYGGTGRYDILSEVASLNNLILSESGERRLPNLDFQIKGDWTISGSDVVNTHNRNIHVKGDIAFNGGAFDAGSAIGARVPTLVVSGTALQRISGMQNFTATNALYHFEVNNPIGVKVENDIDVDDVLKLTRGIVYTDVGGNLTIKKSTSDAFIGGGSTAYVQGPLRKNIIGGDRFTFPVGDASRYGKIVVAPRAAHSGIWEAQYYNQNPNSHAIRPMSPEADGVVPFVSHNEYWRVKNNNGAGIADMTLRWDSSSGVLLNTDFKVVQWTSANNAWREVSGNGFAGNNSSGIATRSVSLNQFAEGNYLTFGAASVPSFYWLGNNTNWFDGTNWFGGTIPSAGTNITINASSNNPVINSSGVAQVNDLIINSAAALTLQPGSQMTINGNLTTNGKLYINNTNSQPASFITHGTVVGDANIKWTYDNFRWWFIGHSILNPIRSGYASIRSVNSNDFRLYDYQDPGAFYNLSDLANPYDLAAQNELRGYQFKVLKSGAVVDQKGQLNTREVYSKPLQSGWQIIANPYPSYYQLPNENSSTADFAHTTGSVYVTVATSNRDKRYETYNTVIGVGSPVTSTGVIAPSQAFYVKTSETSTPGVDQIYMRAANRIHDGAKASLKSSKVPEFDVLRIKLQNEVTTDEAVLAFVPEGDLKSSDKDSEQRFYSNNGVSYVYSLVDDKPLVINSLPSDIAAHKICLGLQVQGGEHTLAIDGVENMTDTYSMVLEDKVTGINTVMAKGTKYRFTSESGVVNDRFVLHMNVIPVPTDVSELENDEANNEDVEVYMQDNSVLYVRCNWNAPEKTVCIYTMQGQKVLTHVFTGHIFSEELALQTGVYIVKVNGLKQSFTKKVVVE